MDSLTLDDLQDALNKALDWHLQEVKGMPMTNADVLARFLIYSALLRQAYGMEDAHLMQFVRLSDKVQLDFQTVARAMGNA